MKLQSHLLPDVHVIMKSLVCGDSPAILTVKEFLDTFMEGKGGRRRKSFLPLLGVLGVVLMISALVIMSIVVANWRSSPYTECSSSDV